MENPEASNLIEFPIPAVAEQAEPTMYIDFKPKKNLTKQVFGNRYVIIPMKLDADEVGGILMPENTKTNYSVGEIAAVGDKVDPKTAIPVGTPVVIQTMKIMEGRVKFRINGTDCFFLHPDDIIAILPRENLRMTNYESFRPSGNWILLKPHIREANHGIILPSMSKEEATYAASDREVFFEVKKVGNTVSLVKPGEFVVCDFFKAYKIQLEQDAKLDLYCFTMEAFMLGTLDREFVVDALSQNTIKTL